MTHESKDSHNMEILQSTLTTSKLTFFFTLDAPCAISHCFCVIYFARISHADSQCHIDILSVLVSTSSLYVVLMINTMILSNIEGGTS